MESDAASPGAGACPDTAGSRPCNCPYAAGRAQYTPPPMLTFRHQPRGPAPDGASVRGGASFLPPPDRPAAASPGGLDDWGRPFPAAAPPPGDPSYPPGASSSVLGGREPIPAAAAPLKLVTTDTCECSELVERGPGDPCSSAKVVTAIGEFVREIVQPAAPEAGGTPQAGAAPAGQGTTTHRPQAGDGMVGQHVIREAAKALGCSTESCVLAHPEFQRFVASEGGGLGGVHVLEGELRRRFKPPGPRNSTQLLSNFNLDEVLQQWAVTFPAFYNFGFNMMDFEAVGGSLARTDAADILQGREVQNLGAAGGLVRRPCDTFACVLNTDVSVGRGKHWVALFGDCRGRGAWSVEYFNSAGNPPPPPVTRWLESTAARLVSFRAAHPGEYGAGAVDVIPLTDARHQNSQTECGVYALYFIRRRLEGAPQSEFRSGALIPDEAMVEFRKHLFRSGE